MKVRYKSRIDFTWYSIGFNTHAIGEVLIANSEHGADSEFIGRLEVYLPEQDVWKNMSEAFHDHDIIPDTHNEYFREPRTEDERTRGWY